MASQDRINGLIVEFLPEARKALGIFRNCSDEWKEDVLHDACIKVLEKFEQCKDLNKFGAWFKQIAVNLGRSKLRELAFRNTVTPDETFFEKLISKEKSAEEISIENDLLDVIATEIAKLPKKQQTAFIHRFIHDLPFAEIAQEMDCPYDTAKANYRHGLLRFVDGIVKKVQH